MIITKRQVGVQKTIGSPDSFESLLESVKDGFLQSKGISSSTTVKDAISDLLQSNGEIPTPDRKGFKSGWYGSVESNYHIEAASERAYLDMNRTLRLKPLPDDVRLMLRHYPATIGDDWSRSCVRSIIIWVWF